MKRRKEEKEKSREHNNSNRVKWLVKDESNPKPTLERGAYKVREESVLKTE